MKYQENMVFGTISIQMVLWLVILQLMDTHIGSNGAWIE